MTRTPKKNRAPARKTGGSKKAPKKKKRSTARGPQGRGGSRWASRLIALILLFGAIGVLYLLFLDHKVKAGFEGKRHAVPAQVYGRSLELYGGADVSPDRLEYEFKRLGYRKVHHPKLPAAWSRDRNHIIVRTRPFDFWDGREPGRYLNLHFQRGRLQSMEDERGKSLPLVRLETPKIGSIYPSHNEDRVPIPRSELPEPLLAILMTIEDRTFYAHYGVDLKAILRATWANIRAGSIVQGGSTLTQQLAKNLYLTRERSFWRKATEALMALIIERRYTKDEILTAYVNEIYLGQDGNRAIHGFGLASHFYFNRPLQELDLPKLALLVGMIRGPSLYNPRRNPQRALERRNKVLDILYRQEVINETQKDLASRTPLGITQRVSKSGGGHPAFIDLVRRQLQRDYRPEDLTSEGLRVFTTLDPWSQQQAESAFVRRLKTLEKKHRLPIGKLEGAAIIAGSETGEILAVVGGRKAGYAGFNRALDAHRPIGSLVKPVVYLAALMHPNRYTLVTRIDDKPIKIGGRDGSVWKPKNFDLKAHGKVPLHQALSKSYNLATVNLGMDLGLAQVMGLLESLGVSRPVKAIPALLLGAVSLSPLEVTQFYQAFAAGGFLSPLRSIREVQAADGTRLQRYPLTVTQAVPAGPVYLLGRNLQEVVRSGTGRGLSSFLGRELSIAGKTGTTNDMRDSWFAGFSGNKVAVVWVGRDDNKPAGLTGAQGALQVWGDMMRRLDPAPLGLPRPDSVETVWIDPTSGLRADPQCKEAREYPFIKGSAPSLQSSCTSSKEGSLRNLFRSFFE